ncbi:MAG: patatin-like phospholipase family protein [Flavobacteriaceae bacterium]|nr:patatin-like phospholipase family protein [Flavobacteriaceae bacterium]
MKRILPIIFIFSMAFSFSQEVVEKKDIKVGLVLSGGGAKGFAHVAVLKVLEEAGVRIDFIGGTSMGAIVGGLYASGYSANQLDSIIRLTNFNKILTGDLPRKSKSFYEKESGEKYILTVPIKKGKLGMPTALSNGQNVLNLLTQLTQHVNNISDFRELPIPFVCIATNLETGQQEVLNKGFLPEAILASGAFPTLLAPVEIDGKLLTDGGIVNNFPVEEVKALGADVIIGVDIQGGLEGKEKLNSAVKILNQIVGFQMYKSMEHKYDSLDLIIKPNLKLYNVVSFDKVNEIMAEGETSARDQFSQLKAIAERQIHTEDQKIDMNQIEEFNIKQIEIEGNNYYTRAYILGKLNLRIREITNYRKVIESINNLSATGNFENVQYQIKHENDGSIVKLKVKEYQMSKFLKLGAHYDDLYNTGILLNATAKHILTKNDLLSADLILGDNLRYNFDYFIDNGFYWSFGVKSRYNNFNANVKFDKANPNKINLNYEDLTNQIYLQTVFSRKFAIGAGGEFKRIKVYSETISGFENNGEPASGRLYFDKSNYLNLIAYLKIDTYDKKYFQKEGAYLDVDFRWYLSSSDFNNNFVSFSQLKGKIGYAHTFFDKLTAHFISEGGMTIGENINRALDYNVGGYGENFINTFIPLNGYDFGVLNGNSFLHTTFKFRYEFLAKNYFQATANYARVGSDLFNDGRIFEGTKSGYMLGYGLDSFLGPIEFNYSWSPDHKEDYWYFNVGYWF